MQHPLTRRSHRQVNAPGYLSQHYVGYGLVAAVIPEPTSVKEARSSPDAQMWEQAMAEEMSSLYQKQDLGAQRATIREISHQVQVDFQEKSPIRWNT